LKAYLNWVMANPEWVAMAVNTFIFAAFCFQRPLSPGKLLYWGGVIILTAGLLKMRG
jgi:hypothetical protein